MRMLENFTAALLAGSITIPLAATALLAFTVAAFAAFLLPSGNVGAHLGLPQLLVRRNATAHLVAP